LNYFNNFAEIDKINSQLNRAEIQKKKLIRNIYSEYELYLKLVRNLLYVSVEKGLSEIYIYPSDKDIFLNANQLFCFLEKKISDLILSKMPLITVEQLKINKNEKNLKKEANLNDLVSSLKIKHHQKDKFQNEDDSQFEESLQFNVRGDISNAPEYYQAEDHEKLGSLDLDKNDQINYLFNHYIFENIGFEKQIISSLLELIEVVEVENPRHSDNQNIYQVEISPKDQSLKIFDLIDKSLENLLMNLSYEINQELFKANLIKKIISKDSFDYLVGKKLMIKHPHPFVINFEFSGNKNSSNGDNLSSIVFFNISTVELEFKNLDLSIQRNKINEQKNQFQRLIKKEKYWRQKEITLNKIR